MLPHFLLALLVPAASIGVKSNLRAHDVTAASKEEDQWWPFDIFGGGKSKGGTFKQKLENLGDAQYFGEIEVGGQKLKAVVDTGSFELLVFGSNCTICGAEKDLYDASKSKTSTRTDFDATHSFGSGTTYSKHATDKFKIGGRFSIPNQSFWEVYDADMYILASGNFQSIFGVGPPQSAIQFAKDDDKEVHEEVKQLKKSGDKVTKRIKDIVTHYDAMVDFMENVTSVSEHLNVTNMSICLGEKTGSPGFFLWDDHAAEKHPEKFLTVDNVGDYYWSAALGQVRLGGGMIHAPGGNVSKDLKKLANGTIELGCPKGNCSAIIDTGTSLVVAPTSVVDAIYDLADDWEAAGGSCEDLSQLPELRFQLNGMDLFLPPEAYMGYVTGDIYDDLAKYMPTRFINKHKKFMEAKKHKQKKGAKFNGKDPYDDDASYGGSSDWSYCEPLIMAMDADSQFGELWILGMPFFRKYYTTFQFLQREGKLPEAAKMSFSEQNGDCQPGSAPQPITEKSGKKTSADMETSDTPIFQGQRAAQLRIDTSKIMVPSLLRNHHKEPRVGTKSLVRPFVHI